MVCRKKQLYASAVVFFLMMLVSICNLSCTHKAAETDKGKVIAKVYDHKLYLTDLRDVIPAGTAPDDSARRAMNYINTWVKEQLLLYKANQNLGNDQKSIQKQVDDYKNSLIIYAYEKELVRQRLDTVVSDDEIEKYYNDHPNDFELKDNIVKVIYVKVDKKAPNIAKLKTWMQSDKPQDRNELQNYCRQFAQNYYLDDNTWLLFDDLLKEVPIETYSKELFLRNTHFVDLADSSSIYFLNIKGFMTKDSHSPLSFEKDNIRSIILNKRKLDLISQMHDDLYKAAMQNKDIEIYVK